MKAVNNVLFPDSVRSLLIKCLADKEIKTYKNIVDFVDKKDVVVYRELKKLVARDWVKGPKELGRGRYQINESNDLVMEYLARVKESPPSRNYKKVQFKPEPLRVPTVKEIYESVTSLKSTIEDPIDRFLYLNIDATDVQGYSNRIVIDTKKIKENLTLYIESEEAGDVTPIEDVYFGRDDLNRMTLLVWMLLIQRTRALLEKEIKKDPKIIYSSERLNALKKKVWGKQLKLTISYNP